MEKFYSRKYKYISHSLTNKGFIGEMFDNVYMDSSVAIINFITEILENYLYILIRIVVQIIFVFSFLAKSLGVENINLECFEYKLMSHLPPTSLLILSHFNHSL